jgi:hypothetical protein
LPVWRDVWGVDIRVTGERLEHVRRHPELAGQKHLIALTLAEPEFVLVSERDPNVRIYDRRFRLVSIGEKHLWVVVKWHAQDAFLLSSHFTDRRRKGIQLWP